MKIKKFLPAEMGTFERQGNVLNGRKSTGEAFRNTIQIDASEKNLLMTDANNFNITYQRIQ